MFRSQQLKSLRPDIPTIIEENSISVAERFQNQCLRPILKLQNDLLIELFRAYIKKRKNKFYELKPKGQLEYIEQQIRQDLKFKNLLLGTIIGQFTLEEYHAYQNDEKELTRRTTDLVIQRLQSQAALL